MKAVTGSARFGVRRLSASARSLPQFLIIGAMRCGTTTLYRHLVNHSKLRSAYNKEVHYFDRNIERGLGWYRAFFPLRLLMPTGTITGEATPYYLFHPRCPQRVADSLKELRLIALLRDPVERAFSHHQWAIGRGREWLSFEAALAAEEERLSGEQEKILEHPEYTSFTHQVFSYKSRGHYAHQLERWFEKFDRESILILKSESLFTNPHAIIPEVLRFLNLPYEDLGPLPHRNMAAKQSIDPRTRADLCAHFEPHNRQLCDLLGWTESW
ncbi:hypothetical protein BH20GEM1_BH20GEM1_07120 [soil metagenome]